MNSLVYFSSRSENTHRFVGKLGLPAVRIPIAGQGNILQMDCPYILLVPSYGGGTVRGAVPRQVIHFLNNAQNRALIRGVIAAGNTNFGAAYCLAGDIVSQKCEVPYLYRFELLGTPQDVARVKKGVTEFWQRQNEQ